MKQTKWIQSSWIQPSCSSCYRYPPGYPSKPCDVVRIVRLVFDFCWQIWTKFHLPVHPWFLYHQMDPRKSRKLNSIFNFHWQLVEFNSTNTCHLSFKARRSLVNSKRKGISRMGEQIWFEKASGNTLGPVSPRSPRSPLMPLPLRPLRPGKPGSPAKN